jgi:hypothetical protein
VWRGGFWVARPETRFARKAGAVRVASETPELDEKGALRRVAIALLLYRAKRPRAARQDAAKSFRPTTEFGRQVSFSATGLSTRTPSSPTCSSSGTIKVTS